MAVVGLGWFGRDIAIPGIERSDHCELGAVVSGDREKAKAVATEADADRALTYDEYADGAGADAYDAVYVVTPNALHLPHVRTAAAHGKHVLCEKPLESTADRGRELVAVCDEAGVELMTAYRMQATRSVRWVREQLRDGVVGDPVQVHGEFSFDLLADGDPDQWRLDPDLAGGGALVDIGVYPLNTARFLLDADPVAVSAETTERPPEFDGVEEHVAFQLAFPDGVTASCTASYGAGTANRLSVLGTEGRVVLEPVFDVDTDRTITVERDGAAVSVDVTEPPEITEEFDYFATAALTDMETEPDGADGVVDTEVIEAVYESVDSGRRVSLPEE